MPVRFLIGCGLLAGVLASSDHGTAAEPVPYPNHANLLVVRDEQGQERPVKTPADWAVRRQHLLDNMQQVMGPLPGKEKRCPLDMKIVEEVDCGDYVRRQISYASEPGSRVPAYLLIPKIALFPAVPAPVAVLCGRERLPKVHPALHVYDYDKNAGGFTFQLEVT